MTSEAKGLRLDDKVRAENLLIESMQHNEDKGITTWAIGIAVVLHIAVGFGLRWNEKPTLIPDKAKPNVIVVKQYKPPPPKIQRKQIVQKKLTRKVPLPDPTPDEPEPIREPEPEIEDIPIPPDFEILIGDPEEPPPTGPLIAGVGDVTNPKLIPETKVQPEYPELARVARLEGNVILQAIIRADGSVGDLQVLRCNRPSMGFEDAAISAVQEWRYEPATQNGRPVEVYFTVFVEFKLH